MSARALTVVVPHPSALTQLHDLPAGVRLLVWDGTGDFPAVDDVEIWVPPFAGADLAGVAELAPSLRVIQLPTSGTDHVPRDLPARIAVHTSRGVHDGAVSEWVLAAILAANRRFAELARAQERGRPRRLPGRSLDGGRVVLLGYGAIGKAVERRLGGFDVDVVRVARTARAGVRSVADLRGLLPGADVLVILVPLTEETRGMVDADHLAALSDGALVVNAARGGVVDQDALFEHVRSGRIRAAIDVAVPDPLHDHDAVLDEPGLLYTPRVAGVTVDTYQRVNLFLGEQITRYLAGEPLRNLVAPVPAPVG